MFNFRTFVFPEYDEVLSKHAICLSYAHFMNRLFNISVKIFKKIFLEYLEKIILL